MDAQDYGNAETMVLACVMHTMAEESSTSEYVMKCVEKFGVKPDWFMNVFQRSMFKAVLDVWHRDHVLDPYKIREAYDGDGFADTFDQLMQAVSVTANLEYYLQAFKQKRIYGVVHKMMMEQLEHMKPDNIGIQVEDFVKKIHDLQNELADTDNGLRQLGDYERESVEKKQILHEERFVKHNWEYLDGLRWPWKEVDQIFSGLKTGLHVLAALASQGKSTMAVDLSVFWNEIGVKHGFFSIDMAADQLADRYPCVVNRCSLAKLNFGGSSDDLAKFKGGFRKSIQYNNVWISEVDDVKTMEYQCFRGVKTLGWKAIIIDYIQLVHDAEEKSSLEYTRVQHVVQAVKSVAKRLKVPIVCLAQLSRAFETQLREKGFAPGLDAIGDSAEIARAAASVTCLYQDEDMRKYWAENPPVRLGFADPSDKMVAAGLATFAGEVARDGELGLPQGTTTKQRREGQLNLAKALRPVWFDVKKNQQGRCGKIPFVMVPHYFLFRPGNSDYEKTEVEIDGKKKKLPVQAFEQIRDDWTYTEQDWMLEVTNAMPQRGCKLMGETIEQMKDRMNRERAAHPEVRHFVDGHLIEAQGEK